MLPVKPQSWFNLCQLGKWQKAKPPLITSNNIKILQFYFFQSSPTLEPTASPSLKPTLSPTPKPTERPTIDQEKNPREDVFSVFQLFL